MSKERDKLTESCLATISSNVWQLRHQNPLAKTIPLATRARFSHVVFLWFFFFISFFSFQHSNPHLRRLKCFFQLLMSLHFITFVLFSFSLFALFSETFRFFSRVRSCVRLYMILPHSPLPHYHLRQFLLRSFVAC